MDYEKKYKEALEKARQLCAYPTTKPFISDLQDLFPELAEVEDERIKKELISSLKETIENIRSEEIISHDAKVLAGKMQKWVAWLEKQGERKHQYKSRPRYVGEENLLGKKATKIEPKFKVGDWVRAISSGNIFKVLSVNDGLYRVLCYDGVEANYPIIDVEKDLAYWTIQDAKDGDVLLSPSTPEGDKECPFIFKEIDKSGIVRCHAALLQSESLKIDDGITNVMGYANAGYHVPATKEHRDALMKAMTDAGYTFDFEKKELKKVEQKPAEWSEEDEDMRYKATVVFNRLCAKGEEYVWSVETLKKIFYWLKSLRPQNRWKPDSSMLICLEYAIKHINKDGDKRILSKLLELLKKLTE